MLQTFELDPKDPSGEVVRPVNPNRPDVVNKSHGGATEKVPIDPTFYLGPPAAWHAQPNGKFRVLLI